MTLQDVHKTVKVQMKCNFKAEDLQLFKRALEAYIHTQIHGNLFARDAQEFNASNALLQRIS